jgi:rhodanese-related sulfurtransferase
VLQHTIFFTANVVCSSTPYTMPDPVRLDPAGLPPGYHFRPDWEVTPREVRRMREAGEELVLIDCRTSQEHHVAHVEGAELVPLHEVGQRLHELDDWRHRKIVTLCHHGVRSLQLAMLLRQRGFTDVKSMAGGIDLWSLDIDPRVPRY